MATINSFDSWTRLREVWLGDVYPVEWYEHLDPEIRDTFQTITEWTREDLTKIEHKLVNEFGVVVRRPEYHNINDFILPRSPGVLIKPEITPRDAALVVGNRLFLKKEIHQHPFWSNTVAEYQTDTLSHVETLDLPIALSGANTVRAGRDLFVDCVWARKENELDDVERYFHEHIVPMFPEHRCHYIDNGGHIDGCFAILKPGQLLASGYFDDYDRTFPNWNKLMLSDPEFCNHGGYSKQFHSNLRFWLPTTKPTPKSFNEHVIKYAQDWVGNYTETFFDVNCLVIDEKNVMVLGENDRVFRYLESIDITPHPVDFRCRTFWDGGLHCLTLDIRRDGKLQDYL